MTDETNAAEIAEGFRNGSPEAVTTVRERVTRIVGFRGYRVSTEDRRDLVQEVMTQLWQAANRPGFEAGSRFWGFVEVVSARRCIDWLRTRRQTTPVDLDLEDARRNPQQSALARERSELAYAAMAQLAEPCRHLIYLHTALDKPYSEIAKQLGKSEGALRVQMFRCIREARSILGDLTRSEASQGKKTETHG